MIRLLGISYDIDKEFNKLLSVMTVGSELIMDGPQLVLCDGVLKTVYFLNEKVFVKSIDTDWFKVLRIKDEKFYTINYKSSQREKLCQEQRVPKKMPHLERNGLNLRQSRNSEELS